MRDDGSRLQEVAQQTVGRAMVARARAVLGTTLLTAAAVLTFLCLMALIGAWRDDVAISTHTGKATAAVVSVSLARTIIRFPTPDGAVHSPRTGVLYPNGLQPGQLIRIEYDVRNPELARVADRDASIGLVPALITVATVWIVLAPLGLWLRRRS